MLELPKWEAYLFLSIFIILFCLLLQEFLPITLFLLVRNAENSIWKMFHARTSEMGNLIVFKYILFCLLLQEFLLITLFLLVRNAENSIWEMFHARTSEIGSLIFSKYMVLFNLFMQDFFKFTLNPLCL